MPIATHLFLDPQLPDPIRAYFRSRAAETDRFKCVELRENYSYREDLRSQAHAIGLGALVALATERDVGFCDEAHIRHTQVSQGPNGWVLTQFPEAVPLPPLGPPLLWDDNDNPLIPDPKFNSRRRGISRHQDHEEVIPSFGEAGALRTYRISDWFEANQSLGPNPGTWGRAEHLGTSFLQVAGGESLTSPRLWLHEKRIFVIGPRTAAVEAISQHHEVREPTEELAMLRGALRSLNPWRRESWEPLRSALHTSCGVDLQLILLDGNGRSGVLTLLGFGFPDLERTRHLVSEDLEEARHFLEDLARREVVSKNPANAFLFQALADAPMRREAQPAYGLTHAIYANLGGGNVVEIAAYCFKGEPSGPLVATGRTDGDFDGRDVRLKISYHPAPLLDGTSLAAKQKREAALDD